MSAVVSLTRREQAKAARAGVEAAQLRHDAPGPVVLGDPIVQCDDLEIGELRHESGHDEAGRLVEIGARDGCLRGEGDAARSTSDRVVVTDEADARRLQWVISNVRALESIDSAKLVALYVRFYPLFQQAYAELGYPSRYFNDRLFEVIDHLLATPDVRGPIARAIFA